jgi:uncharacterized coiled-coil DUF342 family protein
MTVLAVVLIVLAGLALIGLLAIEVPRRAAARRQRRDKLATEVRGHRQEAAAHVSRADELRPQAAAHREEAARHLDEAQQLEAQADTRASELEKL